MTEIVFDDTGKRYYETGVDHGVLYPMGDQGAYDTGVAWNGLTAVTESPAGGEPTPLYADNIKYLNLVSAEEFGATIEAYTYPDEFGLCDGSAGPQGTQGTLLGQQSRATFGLSYRTKVGNDVSEALGYKLHLVYGCLAKPSEKAYNTINESPEAITFSWEISTTPVAVTGYKPTAIIVIDSRTADAECLAALEALLYGTDADPEGAQGEQDATVPSLPLPDAVITLMTPAGGQA